MSQSSFQELDLENLGKPTPESAVAEPDIEIVEAGQEEITPEPQPAPVAQTSEEPADEQDEPEEPTGERRKLTRSQRLKIQRDTYAQQLAAAQQEIQRLRTQSEEGNKAAAEATSIGLDFYIQTIDANIKALRREFDAAFDAGDREKIFEVQQRMSEMVAEKKNAERERRSIPQKAAPATNGGPVPPTQTNAPQTPIQPNPQPQPSPFALDWYSRNQSWFNQDPVMTAAAHIIDRQVASEGYDPNDVDYFEEIDKRLRANFPQKFQPAAQSAAQPQPNRVPTVQNRAAAMPSSNKMKVTITPEDREQARRFGVSIEDWARNKARRELAERTATGYVEIE